MDTTFSHDLRVLACGNCGGPLEATPQGGSFQCRFCGAQMQLAMRDERRELAAVQQRQQIPEHERIMRLRAQDGRPMLPPPAIAHLLEGGALPAWKVPEAIAIWQGARRELSAGASPDSGERLYFLTIMLAGHFAEQGDRMRQRATLETGAELLFLPRHRQVMRCMLARHACRAGDLRAATEWLAPCDPLSDDIESDTAYRFSRACLSTAQQDWNGVLAALGPGLHEVPISDASDAVCAVFRANAHERRGDPATASAQLLERMNRGGAQEEMAIEKIIGLYAEWQLCPSSYPHAKGQRAHVAGERAAAVAGGGGCFGMIFLGIGILMLLGAGGSLVAFAAGLVDAPLGGNPLPTFVLTFGIIGFIFTPIGFFSLRAASRARRLRLHGIRARGQIMGFSPTGLAINNVPQIAIQLLVQMDSRPAYQVVHKALVGNMLSQLAAGRTVPVRVDPNDPNHVLIEWG